MHQHSFFSLSPLKTIVLAGLTSGTSDILSAIFVYAGILHKTSAEKLLQSIASGILGKNAYMGGTQAALYGLLLHFLIAFIFSAIYFFLFPRIRAIRKHRFMSGILYGVTAWLIMNLIVLPITFRRPPNLAWDNILTGAAILVIAVGLPIAYITDAYYSLKKDQS